MRKLVCIIIGLFVIAGTAKAQDYINMRREKISSLMKHDQKKYKIIVTETDTTASYKIVDPKVRTAEMVMHFGKDGKCDSQTFIEECEECFNKKLHSFIRSDRWSEVAEGRYIGKKYGNKLELSILPHDQYYAFVIRKVDKFDLH